MPDHEGDFGFIYEVENEALGTASSFLTVSARDDAPLARPEASDTVLTLSDILDEDFVDVEVLRNVFLADGNAADLDVRLVPGYDRGAQVRRDGSIRVAVEDRRQIIPFEVRHPEDPTVTAYAFIWVPGRDDALPQLRRDAPDVQVESGQEVVLDLNDYVIAASAAPGAHHRHRDRARLAQRRHRPRRRRGHPAVPQRAGVLRARVALVHGHGRRVRRRSGRAHRHDRHSRSTSSPPRTSRPRSPAA